MQPNTKLWGFSSLTGAASLGYRMPVSGSYSADGKPARVSGSNPEHTTVLALTTSH
jgi:hypothetical protein